MFYDSLCVEQNLQAKYNIERNLKCLVYNEEFHITFWMSSHPINFDRKFYFSFYTADFFTEKEEI